MSEIQEREYKGTPPEAAPQQPTKSTINSVRQVLMNELGLTREAVRQQMEQIVAATVEAKLNQILTPEFLEKAALKIIDNNVNGYGRSQLSNTLAVMAREHAKEMFNRMYVLREPGQQEEGKQR